MQMLERFKEERELLFSLLRLAQPGIALEHVRASLQLLARVTQAQRVYVEVYRTKEANDLPRWTFSVGCNDADEVGIHSLTSRGIVAAALASGELVHTAAATLDERFRDRGSVQRRGLEAVLCVPLGGSEGVLYLEGRPQGGPFSVEDVELAQRVGVCFAPMLEFLAAREERRAERDATRRFREQLDLRGIVGHGPALARVLQRVGLAAQAKVNVLITGPSGTGKTQIARAIHDNGPCKDGPFVDVNCAALPEGVFEAELFGSRPGGFTGAKSTIGRAKEADGGTLFLDEIGEIPFGLQAKLLQFLQSQKFYPIGADKPTTVNVRLIAATNQSLETLVQERRFREDLLYRINDMAIRMPSLAERREDIPDLVTELLGRVTDEIGAARLPPSWGLIQACTTLDLPGNVRQLRSRLIVALLQAQSENASQVEARHLHQEPVDVETPLDAPTFQSATRAFQRDFLARELAAAQWNIAAVADRIDVTRQHIYNLIRELKIPRPQGG